MLALRQDDRRFRHLPILKLAEQMIDTVQPCALLLDKDSSCGTRSVVAHAILLIRQVRRVALRGSFHSDKMRGVQSLESVGLCHSHAPRNMKSDSVTIDCLCGSSASCV